MPLESLSSYVLRKHLLLSVQDRSVVQVPLHQLFTDVGHIPRLQPIAHPLRIVDLAVAPATSLSIAHLDRALDTLTAAPGRLAVALSLPVTTAAGYASANMDSRLRARSAHC
jgi:hypothetical protein